MVVLILTACPVGLRGYVTRWLLEVSPGVYVGHLSARVRDQLWERVVEHVRQGRALLIHTAQNEQGLAFKTHRHDWQPADFDGVMLLQRPTDTAAVRARLKPGWSNASRYRKARRR